MPSPKSHHRKGTNEIIKNKKGRLTEKASSFHNGNDRVVAEMLPRPRTVPDLLSGKRTKGSVMEEAVAGRKLTKLLVNVTVQRSPGPVQVVLSPEASVEELIAAALKQYAKEARRPVLPTGDVSEFDLHYSQFSLESLDRKEKVMDLGSRNFFLCPKKTSELVAASAGSGGVMVASASTCSKEAEKANNKGTGLPWLKFMDFLL